MGLQRLAISNPSAATSTTLYTSNNQLLASVIATNKSTTTSANVRIWIEPSGSSSASQYAYIVYDLPIDASNSFETFRFAVNQNDVIKIQSSTASVSFSAYGMIQYDINLGVGISSYSSSSPSYPVDGLIWVDSDGTSINGGQPTFVYSSASASWIPIGAESNLTGYLSLASASTIYLTQSSASTTYATVASVASAGTYYRSFLTMGG